MALTEPESRRLGLQKPSQQRAELEQGRAGYCEGPVLKKEFYYIKNVTPDLGYAKSPPEFAFPKPAFVDV